MLHWGRSTQAPDIYIYECLTCIGLNQTTVVPEASVRFDNTGGRASHFRKDHVTCTEFATVELYQHASERYKESLEINSYKHNHTLGYNAIACSASCYTNSGLHIGTTANSSVIQTSS